MQVSWDRSEAVEGASCDLVIHAESQRKGGVSIRVVPLLEPTSRVAGIAQLRGVRPSGTTWTALATPTVGTQSQPTAPAGTEAGGRAVRAVLCHQCRWAGPGSGACLRGNAQMVGRSDHEAQSTTTLEATQYSRGASSIRVEKRADVGAKIHALTVGTRREGTYTSEND